MNASYTSHTRTPAHTCTHTSHTCTHVHTHTSHTCTRVHTHTSHTRTHRLGRNTIKNFYNAQILNLHDCFTVGIAAIQYAASCNSILRPSVTNPPPHWSCVSSHTSGSACEGHAVRGTFEQATDTKPLASQSSTGEHHETRDHWRSCPLSPTEHLTQNGAHLTQTMHVTAT